MARQKQEWIIRGPYSDMHRGKRRIRVYERDPFGEVTRPKFSSEVEAKVYIRERKRAILGERSIAEVLVAWRATLIDRKLAPKTITNHIQRVAYMVDVELSMSEVTEARAKAFYNAYRGRVAVETSKGALRGCKLFWSWAVENGHCSSNPFAKIKAIGKSRKGKTQIRVDESRAFIDAALGEGSLAGLACAIGLFLGLRPGEIVGLRARDVDDGGRLLWVDGTKSDSSRRTLAIPEPLRDRLVEATKGLAGADRIFPYARPWVNRNVHRLCRVAGVTDVCAHSLRGLKSTMAMVQGMPAQLVSRELGHDSVRMTRDHYWDLDEVERAQLDRYAALLMARRQGEDGVRIAGISIPRTSTEIANRDKHSINHQAN